MRILFLFAIISSFSLENVLACPNKISWSDAQKLKAGQTIEIENERYRPHNVENIPSKLRVATSFVFDAKKAGETRSSHNEPICTYTFKTAVSGLMGTEKTFSILGDPEGSVMETTGGFVRTLPPSGGKPHQSGGITITERPIPKEDEEYERKLKEAQKELEEIKRLQKATEEMLKK